MASPSSYRAWTTHAICRAVLKHLDDPHPALRHARTCLAPGGRPIVTVPDGPMSAFDRHIGHRRHFTLAGLGELLAQSGLDVASMHGAGSPFFNLYRLTVITRGRRRFRTPLMVRCRSRCARQFGFSWLFRMNAVNTPRGWQLVAVAVEPNSPPLVLVGIGPADESKR